MIRRETALLAAIPILFALAAHFSVFGHGFVNLDDPVFLLKNPLTVDPLGKGLGELLTTPALHYPIPVTVLGYAAQRSAFGLDAMWFHATSLLFHSLIVLLVFALAIRLEARPRIAALCAAIFAMHPLTVEPVAWVVGQKDLWATALLLGALLVRSHERGERLTRAAAVCGLCLLAMFSKPSAVCAPALIAGLDWMLGRSLRRHVWLYALLLAVAGVVVSLAIFGHESIGEGPSKFFGSRSLLNAAWAIGLQSMHIVVPSNLTVRYFEPDGLALYAGALAGITIAASLVAVVVIAARKGDRRGAGVVLLMILAYGPVSGLIPISRGPADSYMYLPLALLAATGARHLGPLLARSRRVTAIVGVAIAIGFLLISISAHFAWRNSVNLWVPVVEKYPDNPVGRTRLGAAHLFMKRPDRALEIFERIEKDHPEFTLADGVHGDALALLGRPQESEPYYARAARERDPDELERYALFLTKIVTVEPSDPLVAQDAIALITPLLVEKSTNPGRLARAAELSERYGDLEAAAKLRARLETVLSGP